MTMLTVRKKLQLNNYDGDGSLQSLEEYFSMVMLNKSEMRVVRQAYKYYENVEQHCTEKHVVIPDYVVQRTAMCRAILRCNDVYISDIRSVRSRESSEDTNSSTGLTKIFSKQTLDDRYKVVGQCNAVHCKNFTLKDASMYVQNMKKCMICDGALTIEPVSKIFCTTFPFVTTFVYRCDVYVGI